MLASVASRCPAVGLKTKYCLFPISDRPYKNMCDPNLFDGFSKKKKKKIFQENHKLRDELLTVIKVTLKNLRLT